MIEEGFWTQPEDWSIKKFENISETVSGKAFDSNHFVDQKADGYVPVIRIRDIHNTDTESYTNEKFESKYQVETGDLLVGMDGNFEASFWKGGDAALNQRVLKIEAISDVKIEWIKFWLDIILPVIHQQVPKATVKHLSVRKHLNPSVIPVPPLDEQERIVEAVEERLDRVERLEKSVEDVGRLTNEYQDSFTISLFAGLDNLDDNANIHNLSDSIPDDWEMKTFGEVIQSSLYGCNPETGEDIDGVPYLRISDIREDRGLKYSELPEKAKFEKESDVEKYGLDNGDIVIARTGGRLCGKSYVYEPQHGDMVYASYLIRFELNRDQVIKGYISAYLQSPIYWRQVWSGKKPSTSTRQNINAGEIKSFNIPVPPIKKQQDIVYSLKETDYSSIQRASNDLSHLFNEYRASVLASAFGGKIDY